MIKVPTEVQIKATIKPGSVYYFASKKLKSNEPHYFIVINNNPKTDQDILLVCSSSKISRVRSLMKHAAKSLVEVGKNQYSNFSSNSIVNCNDVFPTTIDKIVLKLKNNQLKIKNDMDIAIVEDLRKAVCDSPLVDPEIIDMLID